MIWERATALVGDELLDEIQALSRSWSSQPSIYNPFADEQDLVIPQGRLKLEADDGTLTDVTVGDSGVATPNEHYVHLGNYKLIRRRHWTHSRNQRACVQQTLKVLKHLIYVSIIHYLERIYLQTHNTTRQMVI